ncbi:MAG: hypothetical protein IJQ82_07465 [Selenomonadaceae bacterium]|nr:hypothetical protein [Selenomonadaceae bacterium]
MAKWERQRGESYPAFEAFQTYLEERTYPKVARRLSKSLTLIKRWAKQYKWRERADEWDNEISRKAMEKAADDYAAMIERQINVGRMFQARGANAIQQMDLTNLPPKFLPALVELTKVGVNVERTARQLKQDKPQENLFVSTLEKISQRIVDEYE